MTISNSTHHSTRFAGRRAVVTGGAAGIGLTFAARFIAEGGSVSLWDISQDALDSDDELIVNQRALRTNFQGLVDGSDFEHGTRVGAGGQRLRLGIIRRLVRDRRLGFGGVGRGIGIGGRYRLGNDLRLGRLRLAADRSSKPALACAEFAFRHYGLPPPLIVTVTSLSLWMLI